MVILTGLPMVFAGGFLPAVPQLQLGGLTLDQTQVQMLMFAQIVVGGILILYMDEVVSKWGVGSGIGLFIIAGVSQRLVTGLINPVQGGFFFDWYRILTGQVEMGSLVSGSGLQTLLLGDGHIIALFTTVLIFGIVVYAESVRVEIPLSHARVKGARGRFPVKLIYASVLPMILVRAVQANIQFMGQILNQQWAGMPAWLGSYSQGQPDGGFFYYVSPIYSPQDWMWFTANVGQEWWQVMIRIGIDVTFMVVGGAIFAIFWVETTDMGPESTAKQIQNSGMQIPGFRQNVGVIEKVMERYIPQVTVIGGALVGLLAVWANMLGTIGGERNRTAAGRLHHVQTVRGDRRGADDGDASDDARYVRRRRLTPTPFSSVLQTVSGCATAPVGTELWVPPAGERSNPLHDVPRQWSTPSGSIATSSEPRRGSSIATSRAASSSVRWY